MPMISRFPFFGKKYQIKFANDITSETHCLVHFASLIRLAFLLDSFILLCSNLLSMPHEETILTKHQIRLARDAGLDYVEMQNLAEFYDDNRYIFFTVWFYLFLSFFFLFASIY